MVKLSCVLVGVARSAFEVDIDDSASVPALKDVIKEKNRMTITCDAKDLQLFLAKTKDGPWLGLDEAGATSVVLDIDGHAQHSNTNLMKMESLQPLKSHVGELREQDQFQVHVLVVVPEGTGSQDGAAALPSIEELGDLMETRAIKVFEEQKRKRSEYSISTCPISNEYLLQQQLGLKYATIPVNEVDDDSIRGYQWSALNEKHPDQRKAYMKYVEEHLRDAMMSRGKQKDFLKDVAGERDLLDCDDRNRLPFKVTGTADMMIVDDTANKMNEVFAGLRMVIEVKKNLPSNNKRWQLLLELVLADLKSETRCAPVALLTNLNDYWYFLWFSTDNTIARMVLTCPANGFKTIEEILKERSGPTRDGHFPLSVSSLSSPLKRQKLLQGAAGRDDAAAEMLERYELMSDELSPEFLLERRMEYAFDMIRQMPIHSSMFT